MKMKQIRKTGMVILMALICAGFIACSSSNETESNETNGLESLIIGTWTGSYGPTDFNIAFASYTFDKSHVVRRYYKSGRRTYTTSNGVKTYSAWEINEENSVGTWRLEDIGYPIMYITWNNGYGKNFLLDEFNGTTLKEDDNWFLYRGDSQPNF